MAGHDGCKGLSDLGRSQAEALRDRLARSGELQPDVVAPRFFHSTIETAEITFPGADVVTDCDWCEQHIGEADGLTIDEFKRVYGGFNDDDPDHPISPGGESPRMLEARVRNAMDAFPERFPEQTVVLFTHGGFVRTATTLSMGASILAPEWLISQPRNTSLTILIHDGAWRIDRFNDAAHLLGG